MEDCLFILSVITAACNLSSGMVNNLSFNGASLDLANMNMVLALKGTVDIIDKKL